ncbi:hypothetical protein RRG08_065116 [Elysia crispata]|uniref:Uncharacterized protein n=1 Tax=Elysia crispata TaxID=231223 RepID=A0AAE1DCX3_9GAST|nr:hypothetical protein RRG08_065116 [Elysia crispata]
MSKCTSCRGKDAPHDSVNTHSVKQLKLTLCILRSGKLLATIDLFVCVHPASCVWQSKPLLGEKTQDLMGFVSVASRRSFPAEDNHISVWIPSRFALGQKSPTK